MVYMWPMSVSFLITLEYTLIDVSGFLINIIVDGCQNGKNPHQVLRMYIYTSMEWMGWNI